MDKFLKNIWVYYNPVIIMMTFIILYVPPISDFNMMHAVGAVSILFIVLKRKAKISMKGFQFIAFFGILFLYLLFAVAMFSHRGILPCVAPIIFIMDILPFSLVIVDHFKKYNMEKNDLIKLFLFVGIIQAILALVSFFIPEVQNMFLNMIVNHGGAEVYYNLASYRMYGFASNLTFVAPILQCFFSVIALLYAQSSSKLYYIVSLLLAFSGIINARAGMVVLGIGIIFIAINPRLSSKKRRNTILGIFAGILIVIYIIIPYIVENSNQMFLSLKAGYEQIINFVLYGKKDAGYFSYVTDKDNYRIPSDFFSFIFGKGEFTMGSRTLGFDSDVGYINDLWFGGLMYILIYYIGVEHMILNLVREKDELFSFIGIFLLVLFPILNFKGMVFSLNGLLCMTLIMYLFNSEFKI